MSDIYIIKCKDETIKDCYVGQTEDFNRRKKEHFRRKTKLFYDFIIENGGWTNWEMEKIETGIDKTLASLRERHWVETLNATLNQKVPSRSKKEYQNAYSKKYHLEHREERIEYDKKRYLENINYERQRKLDYYYKNKERILEPIYCECGGKYCIKTKARHLKSKKHQLFSNDIV